jgi:hypothetical protein
MPIVSLERSMLAEGPYEGLPDAAQSSESVPLGVYATEHQNEEEDEEELEAINREVEQVDHFCSTPTMVTPDVEDKSDKKGRKPNRWRHWFKKLPILDIKGPSHSRTGLPTTFSLVSGPVLASKPRFPAVSAPSGDPECLFTARAIRSRETHIS